MLRWVVGLIPHSGPIELFLVPASAHDYPVCGVVLLIEKSIM